MSQPSKPSSSAPESLSPPSSPSSSPTMCSRSRSPSSSTNSMHHRYSSQPWSFSMCFGGESVDDADLVTTVRFNRDGSLLAAGDKGGRVCMFKAVEPTGPWPVQYQYYSEYECHPAEFDPCKSTPIKTDVVAVEWLHPLPSGYLFLTSNAKTIKLCKLGQKKPSSPRPSLTAPIRSGSTSSLSSLSSLSSSNSSHSSHSSSSSSSPFRWTGEPVVTCKRQFRLSHEYFIHAVSACSDGETFLSADDLRINLWNTEVSMESYNVVDIKSPSMLDSALSERITCATFHPSSCHLFAYGLSSRSAVRLVDLRMPTQETSSATEFTPSDHSSQAGAEICGERKARSISDVKFWRDTCLVARDSVSIKWWDIRQNKECLHEVPVHVEGASAEHQLHQHELDWSPELALGPDGDGIATGTLGTELMVFDHTDLPLSPSPSSVSVGKNRQVSISTPQFYSTKLNFPSCPVHTVSTGTHLSALPRCLSWHPTSPNVLAVGYHNKVLIYQKLDDRMVVPGSSATCSGSSSGSSPASC